MEQALTDEELLQKHEDKIPENLKREFIEAIVYHPMVNEDDEAQCRNYIKRLKDNLLIDNRQPPKIILYDDFDVLDLSEMEKFEYVHECSYYTFVYLTNEFRNKEDEQRFFANTTLCASLRDPSKKETVIVVCQHENMNLPLYLSGIIPLIDGNKEDPFHYKKVKNLLTSEQLKQKRKEFEEKEKIKQIKWLKENRV